MAPPEADSGALEALVSQMKTVAGSLDRVAGNLRRITEKTSLQDPEKLMLSFDSKEVEAIQQGVSKGVKEILALQKQTTVVEQLQNENSQLAQSHAQALRDAGRALQQEKAEVSRLKAQVDELLPQQSELQTEIAGLKTIHAKEAARLNVLVQNTSGQLESLTRQYAAQISEFKRSVAEKEREVKDKDRALSQTQKELDNTSQYLAHAQSVVSDLRETTGTLREREQLSEAQLGKLQGDVNQAQARLHSSLEALRRREHALEQQAEISHATEVGFEEMKQSYEERIQSAEGEREIERLQSEQEADDLRSRHETELKAQQDEFGLQYERLEQEFEAELEETIQRELGDQEFFLYKPQIEWLMAENKRLKDEQEAKIATARHEVAVEDTEIIDALVSSHQAETDQLETEKRTLSTLLTEFHAQRQKEIDEAVQEALRGQADRIAELEAQLLSSRRPTRIPSAQDEELRVDEDASGEPLRRHQFAFRGRPSQHQQIIDDPKEDAGVDGASDGVHNLQQQATVPTAPVPTASVPTPTVSIAGASTSPVQPAPVVTSPTTRSKRKAGPVGTQSQPEQKRSRQKLPDEIAHAHGQTLLSKFCVAWNATPDERSSIDKAFKTFFAMGKDPAAVEAQIDKYCVGRLTTAPIYPPVCFKASMLGHNSGTGGSGHTQGNCKECKKSGDLCLWVKFHPDVNTGCGDRTENGVMPSGDARKYKPDAQPRTVNVAGQGIRWILKKRKAIPADLDETAWTLGSTLV